MTNIQFDKTGLIIKGDNTGWYVKLEDDTENTGGFYIYQFKENNENSTEGFDNWMETKEDVIGYFEESNWEIKWDL